MTKSSVIHDTFVIERSYETTVARVFAAFADPAKKRRWFAEGGGVSDVEEFEMEFRVGGHERVLSCFKEGAPFPGVTMLADGSYLHIVPARRVVMASTMEIGDERISAALITIVILAAETGTRLVLTHQAAFFEGADGPERREAGWQKLLDRIDGELSR